MKNKEVCLVNGEKLFDLIYNIVEFYKIIVNHTHQVDENLKNCERARKTDVRELAEEVLSDSFNVFENIGVSIYDLLKRDEEAIFDGILNRLELDFLLDEEPESNPKEITDFFNTLLKIMSSNKPVSISADIYVNESKEDDESK